MRRSRDPQRELFQIMPKNKIGQRQADTGRLGLSAAQVLRCAVLKQYRQLTYDAVYNSFGHRIG